MMELLNEFIQDFKLTSWSELVAFLTVLSILSGTFLWLLKKYYPRQFFDSLDNRLKLHFKFSHFQKAYHQQLVYSHRVFNVRGLRTKGTFTLEVERVFVALRITHTNIQQANFDPILSKDLEGSHEIWGFLRRDDLSVLVIIGAPGCGKTTLLQYLTLAFAQNKQPKLSYSVPILLFLREHIEHIKKGLSLEDLVTPYFEDKKRFPTIDPPNNWFQKQLHKGCCLLMLDGLDEVAEVNDRKLVSAWISQQVQAYAKCQFVITSRPQG
ncbi:NACHT domain-containing protein, partial [Candidatus Albibeggiatoa sp. nov. BB20]|uniref:NACHT domain-containing protein n=1 Tax=Candidatus Albibeggiatoa sp. nov. BB20 TaxID=3162723 RepID=UPI003365A95F